MSALSLDDLVRNGTMSPAIARTLRETVRDRRSFVVMAIPRLAGKTTVLQAMLAEVPGGTAVRETDGEPDQLGEATRERPVYLVVAEISRAPVPHYIWGAPVRRVFAALGDGVSLAVALHAPDPESAFAIICQENRVPDDEAARVGLVVYLRSLGDQDAPSGRRVATVHAMEGVRDGRPRLRLLHRWDEARDRFEDLDATGRGR